MIYKNLLQTIGNTPLVTLNKLAESNALSANIIGKCEFFNPLGSVKDRIALSMIEQAEKDGLVGRNSVIIEPTSGNTGIGLAFVCAVKGCRVILTMPENMSIERRKMLDQLGAEVDLTDPRKGMKGAIDRAIDLSASISNSFIPGQFDNAANPEIHRNTTAEEIWNDTGGNVDVFIAGVGTGGTITGVGEVLKSRNPAVKIIAVEPSDSAVLSGGEAGSHKIQGIGAGFVPSILNTEIIDEVITITNEQSFETAREVAKTDGIPVGISSGAALAASIEIAKRPEFQNKNIVVILPSFAERYLSTELFQYKL